MTTTNTSTPADLLTFGRSMWASIDRGEVEAVLATFHPDIVWISDETAGPWAGAFYGIEAVATMILEFQTFSEGTFAQEVVDLLSSAHRLGSELRETGRKDGHEYANASLWVSRVVDGLTTEVRTLSFDPEPARRFWAAVATPSA